MTAKVSETVSKRRRGRPAIFDREYVALIRSTHPGLTSERQIIAKCFEIEAVRCLCTDGAIVEGAAGVFTAAGVYRATVLEQLGRLAVGLHLAPDDIRNAARWLSSRFEADPTFTARRAVALLRELRDEIGARLYLGCYRGEPGKLLDLLERARE